MLKAYAEHVYVYCTAIEGGAAWIAQPIMTALGLLARQPFPTHFFQGAPNAARWLADNWSDRAGVTAADILTTIHRLRPPR